MRHSIPYALARVFMLSIVLLLIVTSAVPAQKMFTTRPMAVDDAYWFDPQDASLTLAHSDLLANDSGTQGTIVLLEQNAVHGTVTQQGNTFVYMPSDSFWSLKGDSFAYKISGFGGESTATVRIFRRTPKVVEVEQGFEAAESINYTEEEEPGSSVDINSSSALLGSQGLQTTVGVGSSGYAVIEIPITGDTTDNGGTVLLGGGLNQGGGNGNHNSDYEIVILTVGPQSDDLDQASARVVLESVSGNRTLRVEMLDDTVWPRVFVSSATLPVTEDVNHIALEWWAQGAILDLNGQAVRVSGLGNVGLPFNYVRVGAMPLSGIAGGADFQYDGFEVRSYDDTAPFPLILGEGFEENMGTWDYEIGVGMDTTSTAPTGAQALEGDVGVGNSFVVSQAPNHELAFNTRLRVDVSQVQLSSTDWISFLQLGSKPNSILHRDDVQLRLQDPSGQPQVGIASFLDSANAWTQPGWFTLTGEHVLEVQVQSSPTSLVDCGYVRLWIDGAPIATIYGIDSFNRLMDWMRLGPQQVDPASSGVLIFDDVELWR